MSETVSATLPTLDDARDRQAEGGLSDPGPRVVERVAYQIDASALEGRTIADVLGAHDPSARRCAVITVAELAHIAIQTLSSLELRVLLLLRAHMSRGEVRMSLKAIADASRCGERSASRALHALEAAHLIFREVRRVRGRTGQLGHEVFVYYLLPIATAGGER